MTDGSNIPTCARNRCGFGTVQFEGKCQKLNGDKACMVYSEVIPGYTFRLKVNPSDNTLACINETYRIFCTREKGCKLTGRKKILIPPSAFQ